MQFPRQRPCVRELPSIGPTVMKEQAGITAQALCTMRKELPRMPVAVCNKQFYLLKNTRSCAQGKSVLPQDRTQTGKGDRKALYTRQSTQKEQQQQR